MSRAAETLEVAGRAVPLTIRANKRARRISLRIDTKAGTVVLTTPPGIDPDKALAFARRNEGWLKSRLDALPAAVPFADGVAVPLLGVDHVIRHRPEARGGVWVEAGAIHVTGRAEHLPRRLRDWFRAEARRVITPRAQAFAARLDRPVGRITIRDQKSRWGSCSARGDLSFSWRLMLAPEPVLDYVVAHEVAHLVEHNHSPAYWAVVDTLVPDVKARRAWLADNAARLHRVG